jgi:hypothetical protein
VFSQANSINDAGQAVRSSILSTGQEIATEWSDGKTFPWGLPGKSLAT